jgi:hypothetical protein
MLITTYMWRPAGEARKYEAAGSRTSFRERWYSKTAHWQRQEPVADAFLQLMLDVLTDEQKARWRGPST